MGVQDYKHGSYKWVLNKITNFWQKNWKMVIDTEKSIWREKEVVDFYHGHVKFKVTQDIQVFTQGYELKLLNCKNLDLTQREIGGGRKEKR